MIEIFEFVHISGKVKLFTQIADYGPEFLPTLFHNKNFIDKINLDETFL
jgi:hypothetical protein